MSKDNGISIDPAIIAAGNRVTALLHHSIVCNTAKKAGLRLKENKDGSLILKGTVEQFMAMLREYAKD